MPGEADPARLAPAAAAFVHAGRRQQYLAELSLMLETGLSATAGRGLDVVEQALAAAESIRGDDPRLDYAHGLVLLNHLQHEEALQRLRSAAEYEAFLLLPAWQLRVRSLIEHRDYEAALPLMIELATILEKPPAAWPDLAARAACARWLGRLSGFLLGPAELDDSTATMAAVTDAHIESIFSGALADAYAEGRLKLFADLEQFLLEQERAEQKRTERRRQQRNEELSEISEEQEELLDRQEQLKMSADQWREWVKSVAARFEQQFNDAETKWRELEAVRQGLGRTLFRLQGQLATKELIDGRPLPSVERQQIQELQARIAAITRQQNALKLQALDAAGKRARAIAAYQQATGKLYEQQSSVGDRAKALQAAEDRLKQPTARMSAAERNQSRKRQLEEQKQDLERSAEEWKTWIDEKLAEHDARLVELKKTFQDAVVEIQRHSAELALLDRQVALLRNVQAQLAAQQLRIEGRQNNSGSLQLQGTGLTESEHGGLVNFATGMPRQAQEVQGRLSRAESRAAVLRTRNDVLRSQAAAARREAAPRLAQREQDAARYEAATGKLARQSDLLKDLEQALEDGELIVNGGTNPKPTRITSRRSRSIDTWLPLDFEAEAQRILASYNRGDSSSSAGH